MEPNLETLVTWKGLVVAAWLALLFAAERLRPAAREPRVSNNGQASGPAGGPAGGWWRVARNLALWLANVALSPLVVLPVSYWAAGHHLGWRPVWWSGAPGLLLDVVLLDFLIYWWHRANHVVPLLWRFHEIHHLDRFLDTTTALRFHFGEVLLSALARAVVIILLDVPIASVLVFEALVLTAAIFHHSNLRLPEGFELGLARIVITPSIHWVHHHARRVDTDSNYGTIFSFWDPLFASRSAKRRELDMPIGVEARGERGFLPLLLRPFLTAAQRGEV
ncbi:MAG: sterol desaturase family protein [Rhodospirillales bacterium]|nr:sterol desaturase family protein [Rhodospirillales bacterium]